MSRRVLLVCLSLFGVCVGNPDAKRLYDDLLSNYNRLIRPVDKNNNTVLVKLGLRLSQLIDLVSKLYHVSPFSNVVNIVSLLLFLYRKSVFIYGNAT